MFTCKVIATVLGMSAFAAADLDGEPGDEYVVARICRPALQGPGFRVTDGAVVRDEEKILELKKKLVSRGAEVVPQVEAKYGYWLRVVGARLQLEILDDVGEPVSDTLELAWDGERFAVAEGEPSWDVARACAANAVKKMKPAEREKLRAKVKEKTSPDGVLPEEKACLKRLGPAVTTGPAPGRSAEPPRR